METTEGNKLIAEFMGYKLARCSNGLAWESPHRYAIDDIFKIHGRLFYPKEGQYYISGNRYLKFNSSWDWLMPVVKKIDELGFNTQISRISVKISEILCEDKPIISLVCGDLSQKNNLVWLAVCDFIKWYNEKNK